MEHGIYGTFIPNTPLLNRILQTYYLFNCRHMTFFEIKRQMNVI